MLFSRQGKRYYNRDLIPVMMIYLPVYPMRANSARAVRVFVDGTRRSVPMYMYIRLYMLKVNVLLLYTYTYVYLLIIRAPGPARIIFANENYVGRY